MADLLLDVPGPHHGRPVLTAGLPLGKAQAAMLMAHGRGADAQDMLELATHLDVPGYAFLAPQAKDHIWYPNRFMESLESNEPWLSSALAMPAALLKLVEQAGIPAEKTILLGFSQGACLMLEFAARNARSYGGVAGLAGGLIGPDGTRRDYPGSLDDTPVFLGCSDSDPFIPKERVIESREVFQKLGAKVTARLYPNLDHRINLDEITAVLEMMRLAVQNSVTTEG